MFVSRLVYLLGWCSCCCFTLFLLSRFYLWQTLSDLFWSQLWDNSVSISQLENRIFWLVHPANDPTDSRDFKLVINPPVTLPTSTAFIWKDVWSLMPIRLLRSEHFHSTGRWKNLSPRLCVWRTSLLTPGPSRVWKDGLFACFKPGGFALFWQGVFLYNLYNLGWP